MYFFVLIHVLFFAACFATGAFHNSYLSITFKNCTWRSLHAIHIFLLYIKYTFRVTIIIKQKQLNCWLNSVRVFERISKPPSHHNLCCLQQRHELFSIVVHNYKSCLRMPDWRNSHWLHKGIVLSHNNFPSN